MTKPDNPDVLHGVTLKLLVSRLVDHYGWEELGKRTRMKCFTTDPSIKSSLNFLRKNKWARDKVEALYVLTAWKNQNTWPELDD